MTTSKMNIVTLENFDSKKHSILNACSKFGNITHPESWAYCLHIFEFQNEDVECEVTGYLTNEYYNQLSNLKKNN